MEERTLDELWERIEKEDPVLWVFIRAQKTLTSINNTLGRALLSG